MKNEPAQLPDVSSKQLEILREKIYENIAKPEEYELLDQFLAVIGKPDLLRKKMDNAGVSDYKEFVKKRKKGYDRNINKATGAAMAVASNFRRYLDGTLLPRFGCPFAGCKLRPVNEPPKL